MNQFTQESNKQHMHVLISDVVCLLAFLFLAPTLRSCHRNGSSKSGPPSVCPLATISGSHATSSTGSLKSTESSSPLTPNQFQTGTALVRTPTSLPKRCAKTTVLCKFLPCLYVTIMPLKWHSVCIYETGVLKW